MARFKRIFLIVADSAGIGGDPRAAEFGDAGANTFAHAAHSVGGLDVPNMQSLGLGSLDVIEGVEPLVPSKGYGVALLEKSNGKDTMTGHWEMMGVFTKKPFKTFTDTGFPAELIRELEEKTGHKVIGNKAASGTEIIKELGVRQMKENSLIVYTSADSVLQIAAHEDVTGLEELYRCCEIARELCLRPEYKVGRVIARPYVGDAPENFKRTSNRHDYALSPSEDTDLDTLSKAGYATIGIGKIGDIFNMKGISESIHTVSNEDGMDKTIDLIKTRDFTGLCFVNLVEFDSEYGHRRNPVGYANCLEAFDRRLGEAMRQLGADDLVMVTADHGNDPTYKGTDHTRERVPLLVYSPGFRSGGILPTRLSYGDIGATILDNFGLARASDLLGKPIAID